MQRSVNIKMASAACSAKWPPAFKGANYETWKRDVLIWCKLTDFPAEKQALAIHLSLEGRARDASSEIDPDKLEAKDGVKVLLARLDKVFLPNKGRRQFSAFQELYNLRCDKGDGIDEFVDRFEHTYFNFKSQKMELPDPVMAFMLLASCKLAEDKVQLVMSAVTNVTYDSMKETIKRVFGDKIGCGELSSEIKMEPVFEVESKNEAESLYARSSSSNGRRPAFRGRGWRGRGQGGGYNQRGGFNPTNSQRGNYSGGSSQRGGYNSSSSAQQSRGRRTNPLDRDGLVTRCIVCDSRFHWLKDCPDAFENQESSEALQSVSENRGGEEDNPVHLSLFMGYTNEAKKSSKLEGLVQETYGYALLDTGCSTTVCGVNWLNNYCEYLSDVDRGSIIEKASTATFTFGDGRTVQTLKRLTIPCYINGKRSTIDTDVVECNIPMLLSKKAMKKGEMILNFANDSLKIADQVVPLSSTVSGHYLLPISF